MRTANKVVKSVIITAIVILLILVAIFWRKLFTQTQNQPRNANKNRMLEITSPSFLQEEAIPKKYTCDGEGINPPLSVSGIPEKNKSLALIVDDPDAPGGTFTHWILWNIDPKTAEIKEDSLPAGAILGKNSAGKLAYVGPCPPSGTHRYFFKLYALDSILDIAEGSGKDTLEKAIAGHVLDEGQLMGKYERLR